MPGRQRIIVTVEAGNRAAGLADQNLACGNIPGREVALPEAVKAARGDEGEVERSRAEPAQACDLCLDRLHLGAEQRMVTASDVRQAAADHAFIELAPAGDAWPLGIEEGAL